VSLQSHLLFIYGPGLIFVGNRRSALCGRRQRRGEIFLEDGEAVKKPFGLQPAPAAKYKSPLASVREVESDMEKEGLYRD
jgi:hypothetical protein